MRTSKELVPLGVLAIGRREAVGRSTSSYHLSMKGSPFRLATKWFAITSPYIYHRINDLLRKARYLQRYQWSRRLEGRSRVP